MRCVKSRVPSKKSTSGLKRHYERLHEQEGQSGKRKPENDVSDETENKKPRLVQRAIVVIPENNTIQEKVARFACKDIIPIERITKSDQVREYFKLKGLDLPKSTNTVMGLVFFRDNETRRDFSRNDKILSRERRSRMNEKLRSLLKIKSFGKQNMF